MSRTVVIHQPDYLSHLAFFHRFLKADLWVILDQVQYVSGTSRSWQNRDKLKTAQGAKWITVPVQKAPHRTPINQILLAETNWREDHLNLLQDSYGKAAHYEEIIPYVRELYAFRGTRLAEFSLKSADMLLGLFDLDIPKVFASDLQPVGKSNEMLVDILKKVQADRYLSGVGARAYFEAGPFATAGIEVLWQNFKPPIYPQLYGEFIPGLSSIDLLFNCGIAKSREVLRSC